MSDEVYVQLWLLCGQVETGSYSSHRITTPSTQAFSLQRITTPSIQAFCFPNILRQTLLSPYLAVLDVITVLEILEKVQKSFS